jgi:glyoxylase-like metal-dependent hydrolase (beta-lactamase superfamily II)
MRKETMSMSATTQGFFDPKTCTVTYVVYDPATRRAAVIDPVLDYEFKSGRTDTGSADQVIEYLRAANLTLDWILETHVHADHLSAAQYLKGRVGGRIGIGSHICEVQSTFKKVFNLEPEFSPDGRQFDQLFADGDTFMIGNVVGTVMYVPGHTPADLAYRIDDAVYIGDTLFMPDVGTARADFPGGDARTLYRSMRKLLALPPATKLYVCHDYPPSGRDPQWVSTVAEQRAKNIHVHDGVSEEQFVAMRSARDATLEMPTLIIPSIQVNVRAGALPPPDRDGVSYLRIPVNVLRSRA